MKKFLTSFCLFVSVFCFCFGLTACGKKNDNTFKVTANNLSTEYYTTDTVSFENLTLSLTYGGTVTETLSIFDIDPELDDDENWTASSDDTEFAIFTNGLSSQTGGELEVGAYKITARIIGYSGEYSLGTITVISINEADYTLISYDYSSEINQYKRSIASTNSDSSDDYSSSFSTALKVDNVEVYEVGDDNEFIFKPTTYVVSKTGSSSLLSLNIAVTVSVTDFSGVAQGDDIYTFNAATYGFKFSEAAVGNAYHIYMTPTNFTKDYNGNNISELKLTIYVEDGWNAYTAEDLGRISLLADDDIAARKTENIAYTDETTKEDIQCKYSSFYSHQYFYDDETGEFVCRYFHEIWSDYFIEKGVFSDTSEITTINGLFIHSNITITENDIPFDFIISSSENSYAAGTIRDWSFLYTRLLLSGETFTLGGNYFTIDASELEPAKSNQSVTGFYYSAATAELGHSKLFVFGTGINSTYDTTVTVRNIAAIGNSGTDYDTEDGSSLSDQATENTGAMTFLESIYASTVNVDNCIVNQFLIGFYAQMREQITSLSSTSDVGNFAISNTKVYDCYSCGIYSYCSAKNTITNSVFKRFGGPVILSLSDSEVVASGASSTGYTSSMSVYNYNGCSSWETDSTSVFESYVDCSEAWFVLNSATAFGTTYAGLSAYLEENIGRTIYQNGKTNLILVALDRKYLNPEKAYLHSSFTSTNDSGATYNYDSDTLAYISSNAKNAAILKTNGSSSYVATNLSLTSPYYQDTTSGTLSYNSLAGSIMYMSIPYGSCLIGSVIGIWDYSTSTTA